MVTLLCLMWALNLPGISVAMDILQQWTSLLIAKLALVVTLVEEQTSMSYTSSPKPKSVRGLDFVSSIFIVLWFIVCRLRLIKGQEVCSKTLLASILFLEMS